MVLVGCGSERKKEGEKRRGGGKGRKKGETNPSPNFGLLVPFTTPLSKSSVNSSTDL